MVQAEKLLERMRRRPQGDWTIADVESVCRWAGLQCEAPARGSHYKVSHASTAEILTIPAHRPIKAVYIRRLVQMIDGIQET